MPEDGADNKDNPYFKSEFFEKINKLVGDFVDDEKLRRICENPLLLPPDLNTINVKFIGILAPPEEVAETLCNLCVKYIPEGISKETVLTPEGISNLRKLWVLLSLASDANLKKSGINLNDLLKNVDNLFDNENLVPLISTEEMYRLRNFRGCLPANFPENLYRANSESFDKDPALNYFVEQLTLKKPFGEIVNNLNEDYKDEHATVTFIEEPDGDITANYGLN